MPRLNLYIHSHPHFQLCKRDAVDRMGMTVDLAMRFGLNEPITALGKQADKASPGVGTRCFHRPLPPHADVMKLALHDVERLV
jgi:hypothetical protein